MTKLELPFPPSANNLFANGKKGRYRTKEYDKWLEVAGLKVQSQRPRPVLGRAFVSIELDDRETGDVDNRIKACMDVLVKQGVLGGDSKKYVQGVAARWTKLDGCRVTIREAA